MSKLKAYAALACMALLAASACGGAGGFRVKADGQETAVEPKTAAAVVRKDLKETHVVVANHEPDLAGKSVMGMPRPKEAGKVYVTFGVKGDGDFHNPVKPGEYTGDKIRWVDFHYFKDSRSEVVNFNRKQGTIRITSVSDAAVSGSIDVSDGERTVKGDFEAKVLK